MFDNGGFSGGGNGGGGGGTVTNVTASAPLQSSGGATPNISFAPIADGTYNIQVVGGVTSLVLEGNIPNFLDETSTIADFEAGKTYYYVGEAPITYDYDTLPYPAPVPVQNYNFVNLSVYDVLLTSAFGNTFYTLTPQQALRDITVVDGGGFWELNVAEYIDNIYDLQQVTNKGSFTTNAIEVRNSPNNYRTRYSILGQEVQRDDLGNRVSYYDDGITLNRSIGSKSWALQIPDITPNPNSSSFAVGFRPDVSGTVAYLGDVPSASSFFAVAAGTNTYTATIADVTTYAVGTSVWIQFTNANTSTATLNLNGLGAIAIVKNSSQALVSGDILAGQILNLTYDGTNFQIVGRRENLYAVASGTNTYTATLSPAINAYNVGLTVQIRFTNANTGASTLNLNGLGAVSIFKSSIQALAAGDITAGQVLTLVYDGTAFQIDAFWNFLASNGLLGNTLFASTSAPVANNTNTRAQAVGRIDRPFQSMQSAINVALSGDTIIAFDGSFAETLTNATAINLNILLIDATISNVNFIGGTAVRIMGLGTSTITTFTCSGSTQTATLRNLTISTWNIPNSGNFVMHDCSVGAMTGTTINNVTLKAYNSSFTGLGGTGLAPVIKSFNLYDCELTNCIIAGTTASESIFQGCRFTGCTIATAYSSTFKFIKSMLKNTIFDFLTNSAYTANLVLDDTNIAVFTFNNTSAVGNNLVLSIKAIVTDYDFNVALATARVTQDIFIQNLVSAATALKFVQ